MTDLNKQFADTEKSFLDTKKWLLTELKDVPVETVKNSSVSSDSSTRKETVKLPKF